MKFPKSVNRKVAAAVGILVVAGASIATRSGSALPTSISHRISDAEVTQSVATEFKDFVRAAIQKNSAAKTFGEWEASGSTPADIIENARARQDSRAAMSALCHALATVDDAGLALFQNELENPKVRAELPCSRHLSARLESFWNSRQVALGAESDLRHMEKSTSDADGESSITPSRQAEVDTSKGETLYGWGREGYLQEKEIVITIDDGPHPTITRKMLDTLSAYGVRANFFSVGTNAGYWPKLDLINAEQEGGNVTGSHTMTHPDLPALARKSGERAAEQEIKQAQKVVEDQGAGPTGFFRFPYGSHNAELDGFLKKEKITSFLWNMDSEDWKRPDPTDLFHNELTELNNVSRGIILMHDIHTQTAIALPHLLDELRHRHWKTVVFVPKVAELELN